MQSLPWPCFRWQLEKNFNCQLCVLLLQLLLLLLWSLAVFMAFYGCWHAGRHMCWTSAHSTISTHYLPWTNVRSYRGSCCCLSKNVPRPKSLAKSTSQCLCLSVCMCVCVYWIGQQIKKCIRIFLTSLSALGCRPLCRTQPNLQHATGHTGPNKSEQQQQQLRLKL